MPAPKGNKYGARLDAQDDTIQMRCRKVEKALWIREAKKSSQSLSDYIKSKLPKIPGKQK